MKIIILTIAVAALGLLQETKLTGNYKVEFDKKYGQQSYQIYFDGDTFKKVMPDAVSYKGTIAYEKFRVMVRKDKEDNPIEIDKREIGKDTIKFSTKSRTDLSVVVNRGRMIKIK